MRELKVVGLDVDGKRIICEAPDSGDNFAIRVDNRLRAAVRGDKAASNQTEIEVEVNPGLRPKEIQSRIRAGASVEQVAAIAGEDIDRIRRFANPVLLERARAAELATAAHPVLADGPSVLTLLETVTTAMIKRGLDPNATNWDAWRNEDGRWTVQLAWKAGRSDLSAHFRFTPGSHGGTVVAFDDSASELIDPNFAPRPLRPVAAVAQLDFETPAAAPVPGPVTPPVPAPAAAAPAAARPPVAQPTEPTPPVAAPTPPPAAQPEPVVAQDEPAAAPSETAADAEPAAPKPRRARKAKPSVPAWEDVLLGVRSGTQR
ncbi:septation protein SepH [Mycolicibacterium bacteremicum]|uniref:septation protein SepH n=1 Tax=Mycolicibacterium bacteremicum TaxID=564198 RepID=UPI0026F0B999|nr:septation protein SepH [Mycolicibacterium bacteremicum]